MNPFELLKESKELTPQLIDIRRYLHTHPELGFTLTETLTYVKQQLTDMGYEPQDCGKAGLTVLAGGKHPGKVFLIRGDMDALPITEMSDVSFPSNNGNMHACGHDLHTAMLLGAAKLLKNHELELHGSVKLMFQPAEEILEGAKDMIQHGVLENPKVDAALMIHVMAQMPFPVGTAIVCDRGVSAPAADYFQIHIQGKGCHGSMPNTGVDPITIAAHMIIGLQEINARELAIMDEATLTIGKVQGGTAENVIPDSVIIGGSMRAFDDDVRKHMKRRIKEISEGIANTFRGDANVIFGSGCPTLLNNAELSICTLKYIRELNGEQSAFTPTQLNYLEDSMKHPKTSGSEDFAYVSHQVPSIMLALAAGQPEKGYSYPQHHPKVQFDEEVLPIGSALYAYTAMRYLEEHI